MTIETNAPLLKARDVCKRLAVSERTLRTLTKNGVIPCVKLSERTIRYRPQDIEDAINRRAGGSSGGVDVE